MIKFLPRSCSAVVTKQAEVINQTELAFPTRRLTNHEPRRGPPATSAILSIKLIKVKRPTRPFLTSSSVSAMSAASRARSEEGVAEETIEGSFQTDELRASVLDKAGSRMGLHLGWQD
eukprot:5469007-Amphidinium_carterae.2